MFIHGVGTSKPPRRFLQVECWKAAERSPHIEILSPRSRALARKILLGNNGIESRYLALDSIEEVFETSPDVLHNRFVKNAPALATQAAEKALASAVCANERIDAVIVSTCTGYLCPGLTSYLIERLNLRRNVIALDLVGQGCAAAIPNLQTAEALLKSEACQRVLCVCVEVCSAAFYLDDDPGVLVSACLFGDAAGALVVGNDAPAAGRKIAWRKSLSMIQPELRDALRFEQKNGMLRNILTPEVPTLAAQAAEKVLGDVLQLTGLRRDDMAAWIWHAGGRNVLTAIQNQSQLPEAAFAWSASVLQELGNVSSPFVIHVIERALQGGAPDGYWWMSSFGAGFSCHGALLEVHGESARGALLVELNR